MFFSRFFPSNRRSDARRTPLRRRRFAGAGRQPLEILEGRTMLSGYAGTIYHGVDYSPTWPHWASRFGTQTEDSDMFDDAFRGLWGQTDGKGRNDLKTIAFGGMNEVRLYNWGPSRGWDGAKGTGHLAALSYANSLGLKVMVPVSNYFLGSQEYSWGNKVPDKEYSWASAPLPMREALVNFVSSITMANGQISPAVQSIEIGNEMDLGVGFGQPTSTEKLERALWWVVNLHNLIAKEVGVGPHPMLTIPVSNADQADNGSDLSWFQAFVNGVSAGQKTPNGSVPSGTFNRDVTGLDKFPWYEQGWYFNSYQTYKFGTDLTQLLQQYDSGGVSGHGWSRAWPGQQFSVPLMLTELGISRINTGNSEAKQTDIVANEQVQVVMDYLKTPGPHNIMGFDLFEFTDEPNYNNNTRKDPFADAVFGMFKYYKSTDINDFRSGTVMYDMKTGVTRLNFERNGSKSFPSLDYPVFELNPIKSGDVSLYDKVKSILTAV
jgi:hypothetical protein